jgi:hypothetical protein
MIELSMQEHLCGTALHVEVRASTRSRPIDLDGLQEGRRASVDGSPQRRSVQLRLPFEDAMTLARKAIRRSFPCVAKDPAERRLVAAFQDR